MKRTLFLNPSGLDSNSEGVPAVFDSFRQWPASPRYAYSEADLPFRFPETPHRA